MKTIYKILPIVILLLMSHVALADTSITNFKVSPDKSINYTKPAKISANVAGNIEYVSFMIVDSDNNIRPNQTIMFDYTNFSGINGKYQTSWNGKVLEITNKSDIRTFVHPLYAYGLNFDQWQKNKIIVPAIFKKNPYTPQRVTLLWFEKSTYKLINITTGDLDNLIGVNSVTIEPGVSTVRMIKFEHVSGLYNPPVRQVSSKAYPLYSIGDSRNPHLISTNAPSGNYTVVAHVLSTDNQHNLLHKGVNVLSPCDNEYYTKEGILVGDTAYGPMKWTGANFPALWYPRCEVKEYIKISQSDIGGNNRTVKKGNLIYNTTRKIIAFPVWIKTGKTVEYALDEFGNKVTEGRFYGRISCAGKPCVAINGKGNKMSRLLIEKIHPYEVKEMNVGDIWELKEGWKLKVEHIDVKSVWISLYKDAAKKDDKVVYEKQVYTYVEKVLAGEADVPMFSTYVDEIIYGTTNDLVRFKYAWLMSDNARIISVGNIIEPSGGLTSEELITGIISSGNYNTAMIVKKADQYGVELRNVDKTILRRDSTIGFPERFYFIVKNNASLEYLPIMVIRDDTPPASISRLRNVTYARDYIKWIWNDPSDLDFKNVMVYIDGKFKENVAKGVKSYNATGLLPNRSYKISTHTVDLTGNINQTWVNKTAKTAP